MDNEQKIKLLLRKMQRKLRERAIRLRKEKPYADLQREMRAIVKRVGVLERL